jgi:hypothetical protein
VQDSLANYQNPETMQACVKATFSSRGESHK